MEPLYEPKGVEERWQRTWEDEGLYNAEPGSGRGTFVVAHPPPNVTGALHTGHALQISLGDLLVRWHRMRGFETAFLTGYDHAGISTQNAVEKHLVEQGTSREEVGRERFVEIVWEWLREYGGTIMGQFRRMGASMDYRRERFTMDDLYVRAVMRWFVHLYGKGWIYRANRIINWCPHHETALSDLGLTHEEAEERILAWIKERGLLEKREAYRHTIALCERCKSRIEPLISLQWWCRMDELKQPALAALREGRVRYHPESQHRYAVESLETAPDWNISRQIWWGHQLPVWECQDGHLTVEETAPDACAECGSAELTRSEDVLDTWFSSALWPFAILGWPEETPELEAWYPGTLNTTAREIIRLWENRMIFSGLELMGEIPFEAVIIHTTVLAEDGRRMSKSLGTGLDPLELIDRHGADATRYGLLKLTSSQDVRFSEGAIEEGRKLANKLWNVARLLLSNTSGVRPGPCPKETVERWILARLDATRLEVERDL